MESVRPGDDLYTDCVLALDPDTGKLKWYFQFTPHDLFDFDATETPILIDAVYKGEPRKLLVQANRNGFIYVLDRTNGKFLSATRFAEKLTWAKGIDAQGRPIRSGLEPTAEGTRMCPGFGGATNWFAPSYNESTHLVYFLALEECQTFFRKPQELRGRKDLLLDRGEKDSGRDFAEDSSGLRSGQAVARMALSASGEWTLHQAEP